jgi:hypothetical protein
MKLEKEKQRKKKLLIRKAKRWILKFGKHEAYEMERV